MKREEFEGLMRRWGKAYGPERAALEAESESSDYGDSPMARICVQPIRQVTTMDRGGLARRRLHGAAAGTGRAVPAWALAHVACSETRVSGPKTPGPREWSLPREIQRIEEEWFKLRRVDQDLALALRLRYCTAGSPKEKAPQLGVKVGVYRDRVSEAKGWMWRAISV